MDIRLKRNQDFQKVFSKGKKSFSASLMLVYIKSDSLKLGYSVSKKHGGAVIRNRIKRLLRHSFMQFTDLIKGNYHIVIIPKVSENYTLLKFSLDLKYLLKKEGLID